MAAVTMPTTIQYLGNCLRLCPTRPNPALSAIFLFIELFYALVCWSHCYFYPSIRHREYSFFKKSSMQHAGRRFTTVCITGRSEQSSFRLQKAGLIATHSSTCSSRCNMNISVMGKMQGNLSVRLFRTPLLRGGREHINKIAKTLIIILNKSICYICEIVI